MRRGYFGIAGRAAYGVGFAFLLGFAHPAEAGGVTELDCAVAGLSRADGETLIAGVERGEAARNNAAVPVAAEVVSACARRFDWNREEFRSASHYVPAFLAQQRFRGMLRGQELDLAAVERQVQADAALVAAAAEMRRNPPELAAFLTRLEPSVVAWAERHSNDEQLLNALGGFVAATAIVEGMRLRFARS